VSRANGGALYSLRLRFRITNVLKGGILVNTGRDKPVPKFEIQHTVSTASSHALALP
jgi:hypothetical protein